MVCVACIPHARKAKSAMTGKLLWSIIPRLRKKAPWYIKKPYDQCKISYEKFLDLLQQDEQGVGVEIKYL